MVLNVQLQKLDGATTPFYAHQGDAGVDLFSTETITLKPMERKLIGTGLKIAIPEGYEAQIRPKSGLSITHGITNINAVGTIDCTYRGEVKVALVNLGSEPYTIEPGKKVAQMVFAKVEHVKFNEVKELSETTRNEGGFGSTGL